MHGLSLVAVSRDYSLAVLHRFLIVVVSFVAEHRLYGKGGSVAATRGLCSPKPRGISDPQPGVGLTVPCITRRILNHWASREVPSPSS